MYLLNGLKHFMKLSTTILIVSLIDVNQCLMTYRSGVYPNGYLYEKGLSNYTQNTSNDQYNVKCWNRKIQTSNFNDQNVTITYDYYNHTIKNKKLKITKKSQTKLIKNNQIQTIELQSLNIDNKDAIRFICEIGYFLNPDAETKNFVKTQFDETNQNDWNQFFQLTNTFPKSPEKDKSISIQTSSDKQNKKQNTNQTQNVVKPNQGTNDNETQEDRLIKQGIIKNSENPDKSNSTNTVHLFSLINILTIIHIFMFIQNVNI